MEPGDYETDTSGMARAHGTVEAVLGAAPAYVAGATDPARVAAVASVYKNLLEYVRVHHGAEDALLYPLLEARCERERDAVRRIGLQHEHLHTPMVVASAAIERWCASPSSATADAVVRALAAVLDVLSAHCREEEAVVVPLASRHLSASEWHEMLPHEREHFRGDRLWLVLGLALDRLDDDERAALLRRMPETTRTQWAEGWSSDYEALMALVRP